MLVRRMVSENGSGSVNIAPSHRGSLPYWAVMLIAVVGFLTLHYETSESGADAAEPAVRVGSTTAERDAPFSLAYVPRDAKQIAAVRTTTLQNCQGLESIRQFLAQDRKIESHIGVSLDRIEQVVVVYFDEGEGATAVIFHLVAEENSSAMIKTLLPEAEEQSYAGRTYLRQKGDSDGGICVFVDRKTVVASQDEQHLRRLIVAGRDGASHAKWAELWNSAGRADAIAFANIKKLRSQHALNVPFSNAFLLFGLPPELVPLLDTSTALSTITVADEIHATVELRRHDAIEMKPLHTAVRAVIDLSQAAMSERRVDASKRSSEKGVLELELMDQLDGLLDAVEVITHENLVQASVDIAPRDFAKIIETVLTLTMAGSQASQDAAGLP